MRSLVDSTGFLYSLLLSRPMPRAHAAPDPLEDDRSRGTRRTPRRRWSFGDSEAAIEAARHKIDEARNGPCRGGR